MPDTRDDITRLLVDLGRGDERAVDRLLPLIYEELRRMAHHYMVRERAEHTLDTTALVHEAYLKLVDQRAVDWRNRSHFFAIASMAMRRILVNYAKMRSRRKRGGGAVPVSIENAPELQLVAEERAGELIALDEALEMLSQINERAGHVVECRFFGGLSIEETAEALGVSPMTVKRDWQFAKAWLRREIDE